MDDTYGTHVINDVCAGRCKPPEDFSYGRASTPEAPKERLSGCKTILRTRQTQTGLRVLGPQGWKWRPGVWVLGSRSLPKMLKINRVGPKKPKPVGPLLVDPGLPPGRSGAKGKKKQSLSQKNSTSAVYCALSSYKRTCLAQLPTTTQSNFFPNDLFSGRSWAPFLDENKRLKEEQKNSPREWNSKVPI